jgi:hypothetical protein
MKRYKRKFEEGWYTLVDFEEVLDKRNIKYKKKKNSDEITYFIRANPSTFKSIEELLYDNIPDGKVGKFDVFLQNM